MITPLLMSPAQAAKVAGVSRFTVTRAINDNKLRAFRDNRNNWKIAPDDLKEWMGAHDLHTEQKQPETSSLQSEVGLLRERVAGLTARANAAEADRDAWRSIAQNLAAGRRWWRWPWS